MASILKNKWNRIAIVLFFVTFFTAQFVHAQCTASGPNNPSSSANVSYAGSTVAFNNPSNAEASDNNYAQTQNIVSLGLKTTDNLQVNQYGFSIPSAATICGIQVDIERKATNIGLNLALLEAYVTDANVQLMKGGVLVGNNQATGTHWASGETTSSYGGPADTWGTTWTASDINAPGFGASFSAIINCVLTLFPSVYVDDIRITVYYMDPFVLPLQLTQFNVSAGTGQTALLQWKTPEQDESTAFAIERSSNGHQWESIAGAPQYNDLSSTYSFTDARPLPGDSYYRLKMISASGAVQYSVSKSLSMGNDMHVKCYPNPFTSYVQLTGIEPGTTVTLRDVHGQMIRSVIYNNSSNKLDVHSLKPGVYFICTGNSRIKIMKQ